MRKLKRGADFVGADDRYLLSADGHAELLGFGQYSPPVETSVPVTVRSPGGGGPSTEYIPTDTQFAQQWHLRDTSGIDMDINVTTVWPDYTGRGVLVGIYDDGVEYPHPDLNINYDIASEFSWQGAAQDPLPQGSETWRNHGTAVAGLIVGENDGVGVVGVAYNARFAGVPIYNDSGVLAADYVRAAMQHQTAFDVVNHSWGFSAYWPGGQAGSAVYSALADGAAWTAAYGRDGLGTTMVACAGNDRHGEQWGVASDANAAGGLVSSRHVVAVGGVGDDGFVAQYSNPGANLLVSAPTAADFSGAPALLTTDRMGAAGYTGGDITGFTGTSAATPLVTGVVALMYEANPDLGWRDVREILASSARHVGSAVGAPANTAQFEENPWLVNLARDWNGGGHAFSEDYGFGLVDAHAAVRLAETWSQQQTSWNEAHVSAGFTGAAVAIPDNNAAGRVFGFNMAAGVIAETAVLDLRFVGQHTYVGDLVIELTAPSGTSTTLLHRSGGENNVSQLTFTANAFLGEESGGFWTARVSDQAGADIGSVASISLDVYGSTETLDQTFIYTNDFGTLAAGDVWRRYLDGHEGQDTINAAAVTSDVTIDLGGVLPNWIAGSSLNILGGIEHLIGGDGNDTLGGSTDANHLRGMRGNDALSGGDGNDTLDGGADRDALYGGAGSDTLLGGAGDDNLFGDDGNDRLDGGAGNDTVSGFEGDDFILGSRYGHDVIDGGEGNDTLSFETQANGVTIDLAAGAQTFRMFYPYMRTIGSVTFSGVENLIGTAQADTLSGDDNANRLQGEDGNDTLAGRDGNDTLDGGYAGNDALDGGDGDDLFELYEDGNDTVIGGIGRDTIAFTSVHTGIVVDLAAGAYTFSFDGQPLGTTTWSEIENLIGGGSDDTLSGDGQDNRIEGGEGADMLHGLEGADTLLAGAGDDSLNGGTGADLLYGDIGNDTYTVDNTGDRVFEAAGNGSDTVIATVSYALQAGAAVELLRTSGSAGTQAVNLTGNEFAQTLQGNAAANTLNGRGGADMMYGFTGNDIYHVDNAGDRVFETAGNGSDTVIATVSYALRAGVAVELLRTSGSGSTQAVNLTGNELAQTLQGNAAANTLNGGLGNDILTGFGGNDAFVFNTALSASNVDRITDFNVAQDTIWLEDARFASLIAGGLDAGSFHIGAAAADADDHIIYNAATGALIYDANGSAAGGAVQFATLSAGLSLTQQDFLVV